MDATVSAVFQQLISKLDLNNVSFFYGSLPDWIMAIAAIAALIGVAIGFVEYREKTRPYIDVELQTEINTNSKIWMFSTLILNKGQYPVFSKITRALLVVGDEKFPTIVDTEVVIFPGDDKKIQIPVGHITEIGRKKIREAKYTKNVVELDIEVSSRKLREKEFKYRTLLRVQILVEEESPSFVLLEKSFV